MPCRKNLLIFYVLIACELCFSQTKIIPYQQLPDASGTSTGSGMYFGASMTASNITITFEGPADRWIALGFGSAMYPTDVFVYSCGHVMSVHSLGWYDYFNSSHNNSGVLVDAVQNWTVLSTNTLTTGQRTVTAIRTLNTGDVNDISFNFNAQALNLVWARGASSDYTIAYHGGGNRAHGITLPWLSIPTASFAAISTSICAGASLTYSNMSTGGQTSYTWNFGGGSPATSTATNPGVSYTSSGTYTASLQVSNSLGTSTYTQTNNITVTPTVVASLSIHQSGGSNPVCAGAPLTFSAAALNGGGSPYYQWKVNGINAGSNSQLFSTSFTSLAVVSCELVSSQACSVPSLVISAPITMSVNSTAAAFVSVALSTGSNPTCAGDPVTFSATASNEGSLPFYQWQVNGTNAGVNSLVFTTGVLANNDVVSCVLSSGNPCANPTLAISGGITMTVLPVLVPSLSIALLPEDSVFCEGDLVTFNATGLNAGPAPFYQWMINGSPAGSNGPVFTSALLSGTNTVHCILSSDLSCASPSVVSSGSLEIAAGDCTGIKAIKDEHSKLLLFPNPTSGLITLSSPLHKICSLTVYDVTGKYIQKQFPEPGTRMITLDLTKEIKGIYLLKVQLEKSAVRTYIAKTD